MVHNINDMIQYIINIIVINVYLIPSSRLIVIIINIITNYSDIRGTGKGKV